MAQYIVEIFYVCGIALRGLTALIALSAVPVAVAWLVNHPAMWYYGILYAALIAAGFNWSKAMVFDWLPTPPAPKVDAWADSGAVPTRTFPDAVEIPCPMCGHTHALVDQPHPDIGAFISCTACGYTEALPRLPNQFVIP